jgi:hypothetical protein
MIVEDIMITTLLNTFNHTIVEDIITRTVLRSLRSQQDGFYQSPILTLFGPNLNNDFLYSILGELAQQISFSLQKTV